MDTVRWIIGIFWRLNFNVCFISVDDGGALAKIYELFTLLHSLDLVLETTGCYESSLNGKVEHHHHTIANMVASKLMFSVFYKSFWFLEFQDSIWKMHCRLNHLRENTPYFLVHGSKPCWKYFRVLGCLLYIVDSKIQKKLDDTTFHGYFMCYSNISKVVLWWDPNQHDNIKHVHHVYFD